MYRGELPGFSSHRHGAPLSSVLFVFSSVREMKLSRHIDNVDTGLTDIAWLSGIIQNQIRRNVLIVECSCIRKNDIRIIFRLQFEE